MCHLRNITMHDYQESVTTGQTDRQTDSGQSDPYVPLYFASDTKIGTPRKLSHPQYDQKKFPAIVGFILHQV